MKLYSKCLSDENIKKAIHFVRLTTRKDLDDNLRLKDEEIIQKVKLRLRKYKRTSKNNNVFDIIAKQSIYQVIQPIIEPKFSEYSFGNRIGINKKIAIAKLATIIQRTKDKVYAVRINFKKCFDYINLEDILDSIRSIGIKDGKLISTIKHLMWKSKEYNGIGLKNKTQLENILINCYLHKFDMFVQNAFAIEECRHYHRDYKLHGNDWIGWLSNRNRKVSCRYIRVDTECVITCRNEQEINHIYSLIMDFLNDEFKAVCDEIEILFEINKIHFMKYVLKKVERGTIIRIANPERYLKEAQKFKFDSVQECRDFLKWFLNILRYYDMVNDMGYLLKYISRRLYWRSRANRKNGILTRINNKVIFEYRYKDHIVPIDIYEMRKNTRVSFKDYNINSHWISMRDRIKERTSSSEYNMFLWDLFTKQKGKDVISKQWLDIESMEIHHKDGNHNNDDIKNLMLINKDTHQEIHYGNTKRTERYRKALK